MMKQLSQLEKEMKALRLLAGMTCLCVAGVAVADAFPGTPRREFRGRTYYYAPIAYYSPVWYEKNGVIATKKQPGVPLWPKGQFNKVY